MPTLEKTPLGPIQRQCLNYIQSNPGCHAGELIRWLGRYRYDHEARRVYASIEALIKRGMVRHGAARLTRNACEKGLYA